MNPSVDNPLIKRRFLVILLGGLLLIIILVFYSYNHGKAKLKIETSEPTSVITLVELPNGKENKIGTGKATVRVRKGSYNIKASVGDNKISKETVVLKSGETKSVKFNLLSVKSTRIVSGDVAKSMKIADDGNLIFLNSIYHQLFKYNPVYSRSVRFNPDIYPIKYLTWLNDGGAILSYNDDSLHYMNNLFQVQPLLSADGDEDQYIVSSEYVVAKNGAAAFLYDNQLVYKSGVGEASKVIKNLSSGSYALSISDDGHFITASSQPTAGEAKEIKSNFSTFIIDVSNGSMSTLVTPSAVNEIAWDSTGLSFLYFENSGLYSYNMSSKQTALIFQDTATDKPSFLYANSSTVIYASGSTIWQIDLNTSQLSKNNGFFGSLFKTSMFYDNKTKALYYSTDPTAAGAGGQIYSVGI